MQQPNHTIKINSLPPAGSIAGVKNDLGVNIPPEQKELIKAALNRKLKEYEETVAIEEILTALTSIYTIAGQANPENIAVYAMEFYSQLINTYPLLSLEEIKEALKRGIYDQYGEYYGLNPKTFLFFVRSYVQSPQRKIAQQSFEQSKALPPAASITPEAAEKVRKEFVNDLYADFLSGRLKYHYIPSYLCGFLEDQGKIILSVNQKLSIKARAKTHYVILQKEQVVTIGKLLGVSIEDQQIRIKNIARQFAIYEFFEQEKSKGLTKIF